MPTRTVRSHRLDVEGLGTVEVTVDETGEGRPALLLDAGAGPETTNAFADLLADSLGLRIIMPTHPGLDGTALAAAADSVTDLASVYLALCDELDLSDVTVFGLSIGGWIALEMADAGSARIARIVLVDTAGSRPDHPAAELRRRLSTIGPAALVLPDDSDGQPHPLEAPDRGLATIRTFLDLHAAWTDDYAVETTVAPDAVWATLRDLFTGTRIAETSDSIVIHGPFATGTELTATPHGADFSITGVITELVDGEIFALRAGVNGLLVTARHTLEPLGDGGCRVSHRSEISGPRAEILGPRIGPAIVDDHPQAMGDLITAARARTAAHQSAIAAAPSR